MNVGYLIDLWQSSNLDTILIKNLPVARTTDMIIVEPTMILNKEEKVCLGKELSVYDYLRDIFDNALFQFIGANEILEVKVIWRF